VSQCAQREGIALLRPEHSGGAKDPTLLESLRRLAPDLGVVVAFGQFLPRQLRELPGLGYLINAHASLLPSYRGAAPIAHAILEGEQKTGISVMRVEREMDAGPVSLTRELEIGPEENAGELGERLAPLAADAIEAALDEISRGVIRWTEQDHSQASEAPKLSREDGRLDWHEESDALLRRIRALAPAPGAFTTLDGEVLRIHSATLAPALLAGEPATGTAAPGTVLLRSSPPMAIATGDGWIAPLRVQRPGGRALAIDAFLRGRPIPEGARLCEASEVKS
jgi:methionyl-tRNA formyltransferase